MLRIYDDAVAMCRDAATVAKAVERFDGDLLGSSEERRRVFR